MKSRTVQWSNLLCCRSSSIPGAGSGVFSLHSVPAGATVWAFDTPGCTVYTKWSEVWCITVQFGVVNCIEVLLSVLQCSAVEWTLMKCSVVPNRYIKLENLAWSQTVFLQFTFCRKHRFMKPLLLASVAIFIHNAGCLFKQTLYNVKKK